MKNVKIVLTLIFAIVANVNGHGWLNVPEPRGYAGNVDASASRSPSCGNSGNFTVITDVTNYGTLSVQWTIGSGHGAGLCSFSVSSTIDATAFASNTIASGIPCDAGSFTRNISIISQETGLVYLQFKWIAGDESDWYNCALLNIAEGNVTVRDVTSGVQFTSTITEVGLIDFYRTPVAEDKHTYIVAHGTDAPTSPQSTLIYYIKSGGLASPSDYDRMLELRTADVGVASVCGDRNTDSNIFIAVDTVSSEAGTYKFTATEYFAQANYINPAPQIVDTLAFGGTKYYWTEAFSTNDVPKRIVVSGPVGLTLTQSLQCQPKSTPDTSIASGETDMCLDLSTSQNRKYLEVYSSQQTAVSVTVSIEPGKCSERESSASVTAMSFALIVIATLLAVLF